MQTVGQPTSLFRPVPPSTLQTNLAQHYQRTSDFVSDRFDDIRSSEGNRTQATSPTRESEASERDRTSDSDRIRPYGMGTMVDLYA